MDRYIVSHVCDPSGSREVARPFQYVRLFQELLADGHLYAGMKEVIDLRGYLEDKVAKHVRKTERDPVFRGGPMPSLMVSFIDEPSLDAEKSVFCCFGSELGSAFPAEANGFHVPARLIRNDPGGPAKVRRLLLEGIRILEPFFAAAEDDANCSRMNAYQLIRTYPPRTRPGGRMEPVLVHWLTYLRSDIVEGYGGKEHVLATPAHRTETLGDGLLIELVGEPFDDDRPEHREAQLRAMKHLDMPAL
jgi:hypothetical protein